MPLQPGKGWIPGTVSWGPSNTYPIGNPKSDVVPTEVYEELVEDFGQAARRAREAGFDYVSFHFCHGSLPHSNLSLLANQGRTDKYADRFLFCEEIIKRTQALCGKDFPLIPRFCCDESVVGGFDIAYFAEHYARRLFALGIAILDCSFSSPFAVPSRRADILAGEFTGPAFYTPKVVNLDNIRTLKRLLIEKNIDMPLIGSANLITPDNLRTMVDEAGADFAGVCRMSLDDPDFPYKMLNGREDEIRLSTHTGASLLQGNIFSKGMAGSAQNPNFGRDDEYRLIGTNHPRKVVIVGGGSGGMEYAITAKQIGHEVVVLEKANALGGAMDWAGNYPHLRNMEMLRNQPNYHRRMIEKLGVNVRLGVDADESLLLSENPDVVVIATGAEPVVPDIEGLKSAQRSGFVLTLDDVLARSPIRKPGQSVVIWGAGEGAELAIELNSAGHHVRLLDAHVRYTPANYIGSRAPYILRLLAKSDISIETQMLLERVTPGQATFRKLDGSIEEIHADTLVVCQGRRSLNNLSRRIIGKGFVVHTVGDARTPLSFGNAIQQAAYLARQI